jgi:YHS domain-containing protein
MLDPVTHSLPKGTMTMAKDPVCQMDVEPKHAAAQSQYQGQTYYFCAVGCTAKFDADPGKYLRK